jgi:hypothetical protein
MYLTNVKEKRASHNYRTANVNVGFLTLQYGGGHYRVGTCQVNCEQADKIVDGMLEVVKGK